MGEHSPRLPLHTGLRQGAVQVGGPDEVAPKLENVAFGVRVLRGVEGLLAELFHDLCSAALVGALVNTDFYIASPLCSSVSFFLLVDRIAVLIVAPRPIMKSFS